MAKQGFSTGRIKHNSERFIQKATALAFCDLTLNVIQGQTPTVDSGVIQGSLKLSFPFTCIALTVINPSIWTALQDKGRERSKAIREKAQLVLRLRVLKVSQQAQVTSLETLGWGVKRAREGAGSEG
jgi:hypothetical protein